MQLIDEPAMRLLCARISQKSGDIRVAFDIMKAALQRLILRAEQIEEDPSGNPLDNMEQLK